MLPKHFEGNYTSKASEESIIIKGNARFSILESALIRIEYSPDGVFEDRATQSVINRVFPKVDFELHDEGDILTVKTESLLLTYNSHKGFTPDGLYIEVLSMPKHPVWHFGDRLSTLGGTCRTLDGAGWPHPLEEFKLGDGVCSRDGFSVIDDSKSLIILEDGWPQPRKDNVFDLYFYGFGHDYIGATRAFYTLTGFPPLLPSYVFGNWWSRFHKYTQQGYLDLMNKFKMRDIPFTVAVVDMDWHWSGGDKGRSWEDNWTGYSFNTNLFPNPKEFLTDLHEMNLHPALNLHPAKGIGEHEDCYREMCEAMGQDPAENKPVPFEPTNKDFWEPYFKYAHHPHEENGVDFWWMDWQQGTHTSMKGLDPLWALNHFHSLDCARGDKRPMFFSRYSGPGAQRYFVGFSGDTEVSWRVLNFEPMFTATAANIGFPYWSHDLGGFHGGVRDDELYARWVQFGVLSPISRLHATDNEFMSKEPWLYGEDSYKAASDALRMRHAMFPYLYTMNYRTHTEGLPICMPLYYIYPEEENAYKYQNEYFFGDQMIVSPITERCSSITKHAKNTLWIPEGKWIDFRLGLIYEGDREATVWRDINSVPMLCKAGAIVPFNIYNEHDNRQTALSGKDIYVFPGASNEFTVYEDEGINNRYKDGHFVKTRMTLDWSETKTVFTIHPTEGDTILMPELCNYFIRFVGFSKDTRVSIQSGEEFSHLSYKCYFQASHNTLEFAISNADTYRSLKITLENENGLINQKEAIIEQCRLRIMCAQMSNHHKKKIFDIFKDPKLSKAQKYMELTKVPDISDDLIDEIKELLELQ